MIKIISLSFEESARLERILNKNDIPYKWDFSADWLGCIDKLYDIEIEEKYCSLSFITGMLYIKLWNNTEVGSVNIPRSQFKEVILS